MFGCQYDASVSNFSFYTDNLDLELKKTDTNVSVFVHFNFQFHQKPTTPPYLACWIIQGNKNVPLKYQAKYVVACVAIFGIRVAFVWFVHYTSDHIE